MPRSRPPRKHIRARKIAGQSLEVQLPLHDVLHRLTWLPPNSSAVEGGQEEFFDFHGGLRGDRVHPLLRHLAGRGVCLSRARFRTTSYAVPVNPARR